MGNPGPEYEATRHNVGFRVVERLARERHLPGWKRTGERLETRGEIDGALVTLVKPLTWMNASGRALAALAREAPFEPEEILVCYDELALPARLVCWLAVIPLIALALARRRPRWIGYGALGVAGLAERGRRRGGGHRAFPASSSALALVYVGLLLLIIGGLAAAWAGDQFAEPYVIASMVVLVVVIAAMYMIATPYYGRIREAVGLRPPKGASEPAAPVGPDQQHLDQPAERGEWGPQFVRGVGDELALRAQRPFEAIDHAVEGSGQPADLVVTAG